MSEGRTEVVWFRLNPNGFLQFVDFALYHFQLAVGSLLQVRTASHPIMRLNTLTHVSELLDGGTHLYIGCRNIFQKLSCVCKMVAWKYLRLIQGIN